MDGESGAYQAHHTVFLNEQKNNADCGGNNEIAEEGTLLVVVPVLLPVPYIFADLRHYRKNN